MSTWNWGYTFWAVVARRAVVLWGSLRGRGIRRAVVQRAAVGWRRAGSCTGRGSFCPTTGLRGGMLGPRDGKFWR